MNDALTQAKWAEKKWAWLINKKEGYLPVNITSENGDKIEVTLEDGSVCFYLNNILFPILKQLLLFSSSSLDGHVTPLFLETNCQY